MTGRSFDAIVHEIGGKGDLDLDRAHKAADDFAKVWLAVPGALHAVTIGGYSDDPRELWDIPEVPPFVAAFAVRAVVRLNRRVDEWRLHHDSLSMIAMCTRRGRMVGRNATGQYIIEIGEGVKHAEADGAGTRAPDAAGTGNDRRAGRDAADPGGAEQ